MQLQIRTPTPGDQRAAHALRIQAFGVERRPYERDDTYIPDDRRLVAAIGRQVVGHLGVWELGQWYGGRRVPVGGMASVAVAPETRGSGVASALILRALHDMRARGDVVCTLYPATFVPYRRLGWEVGGVWSRRRIPARALAQLPRSDDPPALRRADRRDVRAMRRCYDRIAPGHAGALDRPERFTLRVLGDEPPNAYTYVTERRAGVCGYVRYEHVAATTDGAAYELHVQELVAEDRDTLLALWRLVASSSSVAHTVQFVSRPAEPLLLLLPENELTATPYDWHWMTRLVDAAGAVAARGYTPGVEARVEFTIHDEHAPWNAGPHVLEVTGGKGALTPGGSGRVGVDIGALSSLFTGWATAGDLARQGRLAGAEPADLAALDAAFAGPVPWVWSYF